MARLGWVKCGVCGHSHAAVSQTDKGTLSVRCDRCEYSGFAKPGTRSHRLIAAAMTPDDDVLPEHPAPRPALRMPAELPPELPDNAIKPPTRRSGAGFDLGVL